MFPLPHAAFLLPHAVSTARFAYPIAAHIDDRDGLRPPAAVTRIRPMHLRHRQMPRNSVRAARIGWTSLPDPC